MSFLSSLMAFGSHPALAQAVVGDVANTLTAAGTTQANALALSCANNIVTTAAASTGVRLPTTSPGDSVLVANLGANALLVYPVVGGSIQGAAVNVGFSVPTLKSARFVARDASGNMVVNLSA
jgi:hypothetical protein